MADININNIREFFQNVKLTEDGYLIVSGGGGTEEVTININGTLYSVVEAPGTENIRVVDQDDNEIGSINGAGDWEVNIPEFTDVEISLNGVAFGTYSSGQTDNILIKDSVGNQIGSIVAGEFIIADSNISINSTPFSTVEAEGSTNIVVKDTDGTVVGEEITGEWIVPAGGGLDDLSTLMYSYSNRNSITSTADILEGTYQGTNSLLSNISNNISKRATTDEFNGFCIGDAPGVYYLAAQNVATDSAAILYKTTNYGSTWSFILQLPNLQPYCVFTNPDNREEVFVANTSNNNSGGQFDLRYSTDGGSTWTIIYNFSQDLDYYRDIWCHSKVLTPGYCAFVGHNSAGTNSQGIIFIIDMTNKTSVFVQGANIANSAWTGVAYSPTLDITVATKARDTSYTTTTVGCIGHVSGMGGSITTTLTGNAWHDVEWNSELSMFIAVRNSSSNQGQIYTSTNGTSWTLRVTVDDARFTSHARVFCFGEKTIVNAGNIAWYSENGMTWKQIAPLGLENNAQGKIIKQD